MTMISATCENAVKVNTGINSCITTSAASPTSGAMRNIVLDAAAGTMHSLPQSLKKS